MADWIFSRRRVTVPAVPVPGGAPPFPDVASPLSGNVAPLRESGGDAAVPSRFDAWGTVSDDVAAAVEDIGRAVDLGGVAASSAGPGVEDRGESLSASEDDFTGAGGLVAPTRDDAAPSTRMTGTTCSMCVSTEAPTSKNRASNRRCATAE